MKYPTHRKSAAVVVSLAMLLLPAPSTKAQSQADPAVERRVDSLLSQLTPKEKLQILGGVNDFFTMPVPRLGIPSLKMSDGPVGTRNDGPSTAYPAGAALAATWDVDLATQEGLCIGRNARARGDNIVLGPAVNIYREPQNGRNFEYFGEDPFLAGQVAASYVRGVQSQDVAACVKHYACNNQETQRNEIDVIVDERTLHEIYLPAFEAAVSQGHARTIMASYNKVNGSYAAANQYLLNDVLKGQWGFDGVAMSDWGATHDTLASANAGLDLEMPHGDHFNPDQLSPLIQSGKISQATIDDKIRRLLRIMVQMGWMDHPQKNPGIELDDAQSDQTALTVAREGIVLLKNESNLLPLDRSKIHSLVLVGPDAADYVHGGGSSRVDPAHCVTVADALRAMMPDLRMVTVLDYQDPLNGDLSEMANASRYEGEGLQAQFFNNMKLAGPAALTRTDARINFDWHEDLPVREITNHSFSVRWTGRIQPGTSGKYSFIVRSDDGSRVLLNGKTIIDDWSDHAARTRSTDVDLVAGTSYDITVEYYNSIGSANIQFGWGVVPPILTDQQRAKVAAADAVIACVGTSESEGSDRPYALVSRQNELIQSVAAANPKTIVVLFAGSNVDMNPWIDRVPALLDAWYPGQQGGRAIAEILFGDVNPSGRLPDTFEKRWEDAPAYGNYPGQDGKVNYAEGIYVGYRWFDKKQIEPRFCFGSGLSYTTFTLANLQSETHGEGDDRTVDITVDVTNTGSRAGAQVVQLYVRPPADAAANAIDRPVQELKGFARVNLEPGQTGQAKMHMSARSFSYWDASSHGWKIAPGQYQIAVGGSSRDISATTNVVWN